MKTSPNIFSTRTFIIVTILLSAIVGGIVAFAVGYYYYVPRTTSSSSSQTRDLYLFAQDLSFSAPSNLKSDYVYGTSTIIVNKGDTLRVHFYNPTDQEHSFTVDSPYSNDIVVPAANSTIKNMNTTIVANQIGTFGFHCRFHQPQMMGVLIVQA
jgi:plastocyanin